MLKFENTTVYGFAGAIRGMRNPMESHDRIDSREKINIAFDNTEYDSGCPNPLVASVTTKPVTTKRYTIMPVLGPNDLDLMRRLIKAGPEHAKFMRMITVYCDITGPLYWWKEFDTYKIGTVANSYSTMHKIQEHEFTLDMFSHECLLLTGDPGWEVNTDVRIRNKDNQNDYDTALLATSSLDVLKITIDTLNIYRHRYLRTKDSAPEEAEMYWRQMIQLLPSSYNQKRTVMMNYQVLRSIYQQRKNHKLDEWRIDFMDLIYGLPYSEFIMMT